MQLVTSGCPGLQCLVALFCLTYRFVGYAQGNRLNGILQALALEANERNEDEAGREELEHITFYEITIASVDQPKLLSRLSEALVS